MKLHPELIQWILEQVESKPDHSFSTIPECEKFSGEQLSYHITLCVEAGYLNAKVVSGAEERFPRYVAGSLTWAGQMELKSLRTC